MVGSFAGAGARLADALRHRQARLRDLNLSPADERPGESGVDLRLELLQLGVGPVVIRQNYRQYEMKRSHRKSRKLSVVLRIDR